jgi:signal transduction histidine kinase
VLDGDHSIVLRTGNGAYTNSSETNTALFALIEEAQALAHDYEKLEELDAAVALAVDRLSALAAEKLKVAKAGEGTQDDIDALRQLVDDLLTLTAVESQSITAVRRISSGVYTLDGRRIRPAATDAPLKSLSKGLYIVNGRKTWVR